MLTNRQLFLQNLGQTSLSPLMLEIESASGIYLYGTDGKKYMDLISGVSVSNIGHCHPDVVKAIREQSERYLHLMVYGEFIQSPQVQYAKLLSDKLPPELGNVYFVNSGSEAVEGALKLAKKHTGKTKIIYFTGSYHGSTHGALSIQGSELFREAFRPLLPDMFQIAFNDPGALEAIDNHTAAVIVEPLQAEAGAVEPAEGFLQSMKKACGNAGALLIFDESQTGFGRLGSLFALNKYNVTPDILVLSKALGGGMPLGAFISSREIMSALVSNPHLGHITTFGGHPVCCAAGLASFEVILRENLPASAGYKGELFRKLLNHKAISSVTGAGLLLAIHTVKPEIAEFVVKYAPEEGLILDYFLFCPGAFRIAPPLTITNSEISHACSLIIKLLDKAITGT